jgi:simple sugar transport system ATP-binding protein
MSVAENLVLSSMPLMTTRGILRRDDIRRRAEELIREFDIHTPSPDVPLGQLSGGNQQRVVLARALSVGPRVLVAHQPTRGLDVGAIEYIGERIRAAAAGGIAVLLISTDLGEIAALADRVAVLFRGTIVGEMTRADLNLERLGLMLGGAATSEDAA